MGIGHRTIQAVLTSTITTLAFVSVAMAQERAGVVTTLEGNVTVVRASAPEPSQLKFRDAVFVRDRIATDKDAFARVLLGGRAVVTIREYSTVTITEVPGVATVDVARGRVAVAVARERMRPGDLVEVRTPNAVAGIRGTVIVAEVFDPRHSVITVLKGVIDVTRLDAGRLVGSSTVLNALQQVTIGGAVSSPQPISADTARGMRDEFRTVPPRGAPVATTAAVGQGEMERVSKDLGVDKGKSVQTVATTGDDATSGGAAAAPSNAAAAPASGSGITQTTSGSGTASAAPSGNAPATSSSAPSASTPATSTAANTPAVSNAAPAAPTAAPAATAAAMPAAAPATTPVASLPSAAPVTSAPAAASPAPVVAPVASAPVPTAAGPTVVSPVSAPVAPTGGSCACVTAAIPNPGAALLKDLGDVGNALGTLKADKLDKDSGKIKKH
jgi:hypothetical protein